MHTETSTQGRQTTAPHAALLQECDAEIAAATKERDELEGSKNDLVVKKKQLGYK